MASPEPAAAAAAAIEKRSPGRPRKKVTNKQNSPEELLPLLLEPGQILRSQKGTDYFVEAVLGKGGFGQVWKVSLLHDPTKRYAMKTEPNDHAHKSFLRLKMEVTIFDEIERAPNRFDKSHFVKMIDKGKTVKFKYLIMDLIWLSLGDVKFKICGGVFTPHTKLKIARQTLRAIQSLHELGYLHRDIKPANFAVGLPPKDCCLYLLDFGISRHYREPDGSGAVRKPRQTVKFMGTLQYASMESLCLNEQARRDDLEVWMYMCIELYDASNLAWAGLPYEEGQTHVEMRGELMGRPRDMFADGRLKVPEKWCDIIELLNGMNYEDAGDFTTLNLYLSQICVDENIDEHLPFDWAGKKPASPVRPRVEKKDKIWMRKKKTVKEVDGGKDADPKKKRNNRKFSDDGSGESNDSDADIGSGEDYETFVKWQKKRKNRKRQTRGSNEEERTPLPRKEPGAVERKSNGRKNLDDDVKEEDARDLTGKPEAPVLQKKNGSNEKPEEKPSPKRKSGKRPTPVKRKAPPAKDTPPTQHDTPESDTNKYKDRKKSKDSGEFNEKDYQKKQGVRKKESKKTPKAPKQAADKKPRVLATKADDRKK